MTRWLKLALTVALLSLGAAGCYASHTRPAFRDAGAGPRDAGGAVDATLADARLPDAGIVDCRQRDITAVLAPTAVRLGEPVPVLVSAPGASCGCTPRGFFRFGREGGTFVGLEACGCSDSDPCVDSRYEATAFVDAPSAIGPWEAATSVGTVSTQVVPPEACGGSLRVLRIEPLGVDPGAIHDSPVGVFARVVYEAFFCCAEPLPVASETPTSESGVRTYDLLDCVSVDCACDPGGPRTLTAIVYLGQLAPGPQRVRIGAVETTVDVPSR